MENSAGIYTKDFREKRSEQYVGKAGDFKKKKHVFQGFFV